ncbi:MAG: heme exporter protein CcmB [Chloroflexi bacterium]|nr:heme exporter protein CcmB [Chloroflexota bacterium]
MRTREVVSSVLVFTLLVILIFTLAFGADRELMTTVAPGILWATFAFAGVLSFSRSFVPEKEHGCLEGLMAAPISREVIYAGKGLSSLLFMLIVEAIALPAFAFFSNVPVLSPQIILVTFVTTVGFVAVGTLFSALSANTRAREMVLPVLFLPIVIPILISAIKVSELALTGEPWSNLFTWFQIIGAFDLVFLAVSYLVFDFVIVE